MEEEFEEFEEHPQDVMEQYQDYPYDCDGDAANLLI